MKQPNLFKTKITRTTLKIIFSQNKLYKNNPMFAKNTTNLQTIAVMYNN